MEKAPFYADIDEGPAGGAAYWIETSDGLRLRLGLWNGASEASKGTVLLFPGRTEYIEKYGRAAGDLAARGYATLAIDWRGQGLAERMVDDARTGHVHHFTDYQHDVKAMIAAAEALDLPRPWHLIAHSMGGCIGLRALIEGLPVSSAVFSAPMWGIFLAAPMRAAAWALTWGSSHLGIGHKASPGTNANAYVLVAPFENNKLTTDRDMYEYMQRHARAYPALGLGGPSLRWLHEALTETRILAKHPSPDVPCLTLLGTNERIVDVPRVHQRMARWPGGQLKLVEKAEHEVMMESAEMRARIFDQIAQFFDDHASPQDTAKTA